MRSKYTVPAAGIALGGVLAATAVVIMSLGTLIPVATFVCPMACTVLLQTVLRLCGKRLAWAWYGAVTVLSLLLAPDKEAALVFAFLGWYPIVRPDLEKTRLKWLWKGMLFNGSILLLYGLILRLLGMNDLLAEYREMGALLTAVLLVLGNVTFFLLDRLLGMRPGRKKQSRGR